MSNDLICPDCGGDGRGGYPMGGCCLTCNGSGRVSQIYGDQACESCGGQGQIGDITSNATSTCRECRGSGRK